MLPVGSHTLKTYYNGQSVEKSIELTDPGEKESVELEIIKIRIEDLEEKEISFWWYIIPLVSIISLFLISYLRKKTQVKTSF